MRRALLISLAPAALAIASGFGVGFSGADFTARSANPGNSLATAADYAAPTASASIISKTQGGATGFIRAGGTYYVYANVTDTGNPASGTASVTADVSALTPGQTAAPLSAGSYSAGGATYNYRSAALTAGSTVTAGSKAYSLRSTDAAANARTQTGFTVTVDNTAPAGSDIQTANGGTKVGRPETNDRLTYTFTKALDPDSVLAGWSGASTAVTVRIADGGAGNDTVTIWNAGNSAQLPLGTVDLGRTDYVTATATFTSSTMTASGATITVTLGTLSGGTVGTAAKAGTMTWTPSAAATDAAGNPVSTAPVTETGTADLDF